MTTLGVLIHGPEVIDEGETGEALANLRKAGFEVEAALGGITGKTAVIDAGLQHTIDISKDMKPSEVLKYFLKRDLVFIVLVNHAKTETSGFMLGEGILRNFIDSGGATENLSFVQLEYRSRIIIRWRVNAEDEAIFKAITGLFTEFEVREPYKLESRCKKESNMVYRELKGVHPGEKIVVDGVIVGMASRGDNVTLVAREGQLVDIQGGTLIQHNLVKLPHLDLENELIKTASVIRRTKPKVIGDGSRKGTGKKVACFFYTVEPLFPKIEAQDADIAVAVTIGDDTTCIAGDILKRFGIRMIGITDGDADGLIDGIKSGALDEYAKFMPAGSMIIRLKPERDDIVGEKIKAEIFMGGEELELDGDVETHFEDLKLRILAIAKADIIGVLSSSVSGKDDLTGLQRL
ncbi:MAG: DUF2117 domain-containing protein [Methanophagales archaeon]|nr:hypothetical protein C5S35_04470 [Methanophagales archaeon]MCK4732397.1 DUF2117 domain-containing protein [Methanophagales archaeon]